jgi:hypothetical protein
MNVNTVPDHVFDKWAHELADLQRDYPHESAAVDYMLDEFKDFTGDGGSHLPLLNQRAYTIARLLKEGPNG